MQACAHPAGPRTSWRVLRLLAVGTAPLGEAGGRALPASPLLEVAGALPRPS